MIRRRRRGRRRGIGGGRRNCTITIVLLILVSLFLFGGDFLSPQQDPLPEPTNNGLTYEPAAPTTQTEGRFETTLVRHIDADTTVFRINGEEIRVRYLAIDADEIRGEEATELGQIASEHVRDRLENASIIELELDPARPGPDRWGRELAWVWVDGILLQEELVRLGLAEIAFANDQMLYVYRLEQALLQRE